MWRYKLAVPVVLTILSAAPAFAIPLIDTTGAVFEELRPFGEPNTGAYGQTFTVTGPETQLDSFAFRFDDFLNAASPDFVDFAAYVYAWDGAKATGAQLYASSPQTTTNNGGADGFELFSFATGGLQLTAGQEYVAFVSSSNFFDGITGTARTQISHRNPYAGGNAAWINNGSDFAALTNNPWFMPTSSDFWFLAAFSTPAAVTPVPEPGSLLLLVSGLVLYAAQRRRRR